MFAVNHAMIGPVRKKLEDSIAAISYAQPARL
jgi:hypothetical protein